MPARADMAVSSVLHRMEQLTAFRGLVHSLCSTVSWGSEK